MSRYYPNLFAYLRQSSIHLSDSQHLLHGRDRPILVLEEEEVPRYLPGLRYWYGTTYEIPFPYLQLSDLPQCRSLTTLSLQGKTISLLLTDEVVDAASVKEEQKLQNWDALPVDTKVSEQLQLLNGLFQPLLNQSRGHIRVLELPILLKNFSPQVAVMPPIVYLDQKYKLTENLWLIAAKLRQQLRRQTELIPISRIQEMDAYCLRDYTRRPGRTGIQKAGSKQMLMGIKRYQDYNTSENKFLVYFVGKLLHLECARYRRTNAQGYRHEMQSLQEGIDYFTTQETVQTIQVENYQLTRPNYVLLQNPIYNKFYQAYLELIKRQTLKEQLWSYRQALLADAVYILLLNTIICLPGAVPDAVDHVSLRPHPDQGCYLQFADIKIPVYSTDRVYLLRLGRFLDHADIQLTVEIHDLHSPKLEITSQIFLIWVFWYCPSSQVLEEAIAYLRDQKSKIQGGLIFYLDLATEDTVVPLTDQSSLRLVPLPPLTAEMSLSSVVTYLSQVLQFIHKGI